MRYSTTSLSAITLCVCMMLSHHTNGMDMWGTPPSFTNNNPNQIQMADLQWNQQPNTNMQSGSNNWNNVATPMHLNNNQGQQWNQQPNTNMQSGSNNWNNVATPMHLNNNQGQQWNQQPSANIKFRSVKWNKAVLSPDHPSNKYDKSQHMPQPQSAERMIIHTTPYPKSRRDLTIHFSGKYKFKPMVWQGSFTTFRYQIKERRGNKSVLVTCNKGNEKYENTMRFYDYVERIDDPEYKKKLDAILLRRIDSAQTADGEMGCFVFDLPNKEDNSMTAYLKRKPKFELVQNTPRLVARVMEAVSTLNEIGVVYNIMGGDHVWVSSKYSSNIIHGIKLINFGHTIIYEDFRRLVMTNVGLSPSPELTPMLSSFMNDVKAIGQFISKLFTNYNGLLDKEFTYDPPPRSQWEAYELQKEILGMLRDAMLNLKEPKMVLHFMDTDAYRLINAQV